MKNITTTMIVVICIAAGAGGMIIAQRQGWLGGQPSQPAANADSSCEHDITEDKCPFCTPGLIESMGFCGGHGVPEAYCTRCNDYLIPAFKAKGDWCGEHGLPESQCTICNPELVHSEHVSYQHEGEHDYSTPHAAASEVTRGLIVSPDAPRSQQPGKVACDNTAVIVTLASPEVAQTIGIQVEPVVRKPIKHTITANATVGYDRNRYTMLSSPISGIVRQVHKDQGDEVRAGEALAIVDSADLASAKADYLQAMALLQLWEKNHKREKDLLERGAGTVKDEMQAATNLTENRVAVSRARQRLVNLSLTQDQIETVAREEDTGSLLAIVAPFDGIVVDRTAVRGQVIGTDEPLFSIADLSAMWAVLDVYDSDVGTMGTGQPVTLKIDGLRGESFGGTITWISPEVDAATRTLKVRAEFENTEGLLRANMFGKATVIVSRDQQQAVVPKNAVQWEGCCNVVFVKLSDTVYEPRKVRLGYETGDHYAVVDGVRNGEPVVTEGSFLLKTEILRGSIGAGCCEHNPAASKG